MIDFNNNPVANLSVGFYFDDNMWDAIWAEYDIKGQSFTMNNLKKIFPDDKSLAAITVKRTGS